MKFAVLSAVLMAAGMAGLASAQVLPSQERVRGGIFDASEPGAIVKFMEGAGYRAALATDAHGDPLIRGRLSRTDYLIEFYECKNGAFCNSMQLRAEARPAGAVSLEEINAFNLRWRYVRAAQTDAGVRIQMDINLDSGVTADNLEDTLDIWRQLLETYERELLRYS
jgi:hypothetical protein